MNINDHEDRSQLPDECNGATEAGSAEVLGYASLYKVSQKYVIAGRTKNIRIYPLHDEFKKCNAISLTVEEGETLMTKEEIGEVIIALEQVQKLIKA
jgi:hypothetical protein